MNKRILNKLEHRAREMMSTEVAIDVISAMLFKNDVGYAPITREVINFDSKSQTVEFQYVMDMYLNLEVKTEMRSKKFSKKLKGQ